MPLLATTVAVPLFAPLQFISVPLILKVTELGKLRVTLVVVEQAAASPVAVTV